MLGPLSRTRPPSEIKGRDFLSLCAWRNRRNVRGRSTGGEKYRERGRYSRVWHLKSMCHRNARRDSLPFTSPRKKNGRYWHTSTRKVVLVLTTRWLQGFILSAFTVSHPSCNTVWSLKHCLTCHNALCRSSVKCLLWLWRLYLQWSQMSHDVSFVLQHVPVLTKQSNRLTVCLCVFIFDLRRLLQLTLFTAMFFSLQCVDDFYRHHPLFHAFSELLVHLFSFPDMKSLWRRI